MTIEAVIVQTLQAWPALAGYVLRFDKVEEADTAPYIVIQKITGTRVSSLTGDSGLSNPHFQFDVYASTRVLALTIREQVRKALEANITLSAIHFNEGAGFDPETKLRRERQDFSFWFND